ncbi:MAG: O-antigen ligase family protein [Betaproteobacteria bacterium]
MFTSFAFTFANFFQPGVFWPELADFKPMQVIAILALLTSLTRPAGHDRMEAVRQPAVKWMLVFLFVQVLSVYRTGLSGMLTEFGVWSIYALFALVSVRIVTDPAKLRRYIWGMMVGSTWIVGWGIYAVYAGLLAANGGRAGAYGMYENHNDYSFIIVQTLPFYYIYWRTETGFLRRLFLLVSLLLCIVGIFLSLSRGGMIALVLEMSLIVFLTMGRRARFVLLPLVLALGGAAVSYQYIARAANQGEGYTAEDAESSRLELWDAGLHMVLAHPFLGVGSRSFGENSAAYGEISHDNLGKNAHNTFIEITATTGLFGIGAFLAMLLGAIRELRRPTAGIASAWEENTRKATLIALCTICFRALFDVKSWDWSFYILATIAAISGAMMKSRSPPVDATVDEGGPAAPVLPPTNKLTT